MTRGDDIQALLLDVGQVILRVNVPRAAAFSPFCRA